MSEEDITAAAINAASFAASNLVYDYAARFPEREQYEPLEALAQRVQEAAVRAGCAAARKASREA